MGLTWGLTWGLTCVCANALAGSNASFSLMGQIPAIVSAHVTSTATASAAWRALASDKDIELAKIVETNNSFGTYVVAISSRNHGRLLGARGGARASGIPYELSCNDQPVDLVSGHATIARAVRAAGTKTTHVLKLRLASNAPVDARGLASSNATDVVTFSIAAP